ncbi:MAG: Calx-beta domain-containing protein [Alphaproteobacteria bacterium]
MRSGETVEGSVIRSLGKTLSIKLPARGMMQLPINAIDRVEIELDSGETIAGSLHGWSKGVYRIEVDGRLLDLANADGSFAIAAEAVSEEDSRGVGGPRVVLAERESEPVQAVAGDIVTEQETPPQAVETAAVESGLLPLLSGSSLPVDEGEEEAIFTLSLSEPASRPIVVLYSALEQEAKGGVDYRGTAGVATFEVGDLNVDVSIPVIDDDVAEPNESFKLFLTVDPHTATLKDREIVTVILDND